MWARPSYLRRQSIGGTLHSIIRSRVACLLYHSSCKTENICKMGTRITKMRRDKYDIQGQNFKEDKVKISNTTAASAVTMSPQNTNTVEQFLCSVDDLKDNEMKEFALEGDNKVLLVKENGEFTAFGNKCTHYGAPLINGILCNGYIRCPWHGACFNSKTGDIEDFPGLDSIPKYEIQIEDGKVKIKAAVNSTKRLKPMVKRNENNNETFIIIGGGAAGAKCVETLRQEGFQGRITMITKEEHLPYDRPKLSKALDMTADKIALRSSDFYNEYNIEILKNKEVISINSVEKFITLDDDTKLSFKKLLIATGGIPRILNIPGSNLNGLRVLRSVDDANAIATESQGKKVVILGTSFIGMECAAFLIGKAASVNVIGSLSVPFEPVLGKEIGARLKALFEEKGVVFHMNDTITEVVGGGCLQEVVLKSGQILPADLCLLGVGVQPATKFLENSGINMEENFILVDEHMMTNVGGIYAAGDIVKFPLFFMHNQQVNVQHWQMAHYHGHIAGLNMADKLHKVHTVPFFWTMFFGMSLRYTGFGAGYDTVIVTGNLQELEFIAYYLKEDVVRAVATMKRDPVASQFAELLRAGKALTKDKIEPSLDLKKLLY